MFILLTHVIIIVTILYLIFVLDVAFIIQLYYHACTNYFTKLSGLLSYVAMMSRSLVIIYTKLFIVFNSCVPLEVYKVSKNDCS
jgi:hypothetical protein